MPTDSGNKFNSLYFVELECKFFGLQLNHVTNRISGTKERGNRVKLLSLKITSIGLFLAELAVYAVLVTAYFFLVLHFLGDWIKHVFDGNKVFYAMISVALIVVQGALLELLTRVLFNVIHRKLK